MTGGLVWYAAYGSNTLAARFDCYLRGGRPAGGRRRYPGCRDPAAPRAAGPVRVPGRLVFAGTSTVWGGGMAFLDDAAPGTSPARAWLVTAQQFADVAAQEMHRAPGSVDLDGLTPGRHVLGPGRYETVVVLGEREGVPLVTVTCPDPPPTADLRLAAPSPGYLAVVAAGLREAGWPAGDVAAHLAGVCAARTDRPPSTGSSTPVT